MGNYKCDFCGKEFSCSQAKGGHMKYCIDKKKRDGDESESMTITESMDKYKYDICGREFSSYQAKGGHIKHCTDEKKKKKKKNDGDGGERSAAAHNNNLAAAGGGLNKEMARRRWPTFSIALSQEEVEEDLKALNIDTSKRPKRRPIKVQKVLDSLFPGLSLQTSAPAGREGYGGYSRRAANYECEICGERYTNRHTWSMHMKDCSRKDAGNSNIKNLDLDLDKRSSKGVKVVSSTGDHEDHSEHKKFQGLVDDGRVRAPANDDDDHSTITAMENLEKLAATPEAIDLEDAAYSGTGTDEMMNIDYFKCEQCPMSFLTLQALEIHKAASHGNGNDHYDSGATQNKKFKLFGVYLNVPVDAANPRDQ